MTLSYKTPDDQDIVRDRNKRWLVLIGTTILTPVISGVAGASLGGIFFGGFLPVAIGFIAGVAAGIITTNALLAKYFFIVNNSTGMFVTIDRIRSALGLSDINVSYGPGTHICFPWEQRLEENNIPLEQAAVTFEFDIMCTDGLLSVKGSSRLRPDMLNPIAFLTGVAGVAEDITDLVISHAVEKLAGTTVMKATKFLPKLNTSLREEFVTYPDDATRDARAAEYDIKPTTLRKGQTVFEARFGVGVDDIVIKEMLPSEEVRRTISALTEAAVIKKGTALLLGLSMKQVADRLKDGSLTTADYNKARDRFLAVSGNMEGVDIKRFELDVDPKVAEAVVSLASQLTPERISQISAAVSAGKGGKKK